MPKYDIDGGRAYVVVEVRGGENSPLEVDFKMHGIKAMLNAPGYGGQIHWAVLGDNGEWQAPSVQPTGSGQFDAVASRSGIGGNDRAKMTFQPDSAPDKITFVLFIECQGQQHWLKSSGGKDFVVDLKELAKASGQANGSFAPPARAGARVAPREAEWKALIDAKALAAKEIAAGAAAVASPKPRRRKQAASSSAVTRELVKEGKSGIQNGMGDIAWTVVITKEMVSVFLEASMALIEGDSVNLHWGCASAGGAEWESIDAEFPNAKKHDAVAFRTTLEAQARAELKFNASKAPQWISFVIFVTAPEGGEQWIKSQDGNNFWIDVLADKNSMVQGQGGGGQTTDQKFCDAETKYPHWTQKDRICLANDILVGDLNEQDAAWVATDLCLANAKVLEWYRKSGYQPKDMAYCQERIGNTLAAAHSKTPNFIVRTLLRLCARAIPRGSSSGGDAIRHGILNMMRTHGIKEGHRPGIDCQFIGQWHQKLHTNSAPDDIAICKAYLAFLRSGNVDDLWRVIWEEAKLTRDDLGKMCQAGFVDHTKSGAKGLNCIPLHLPQLIGDMENYLNLLKHVHGGSDLLSLCEACKGQYPDHGAECLAFEIFHNRDDYWTVFKILDLRRKLASNLAKRDIMILDVALEDQLRSLVERTNIGAMSKDDLLNLLTTLIDDLLLSRNQLSLEQGAHLLRRLVSGDKGGLAAWSPDWCKMVHAACDRIALTCAGTADKVATLLQNCADKLNEAGQRPGAVFKPDSKALTTFGEEKARCLTERLVAQCLKSLMPQLRRGAGLGPWEIVSQGVGGQATGTVEVMAALPLELPAGKGPVVAVVETMTGWEDIPAGIAALLLPASQAVDTLSHVAIRARNQQVLLASCDEESIMKELSAAAGKNVKVEITAGGISWAVVAAVAQPDEGKDKTAAAPKAVMQKITPPPAPPSAVIDVTEFVNNKRSLGGKSLHLAELQPAKEQYSVPFSCTVPYGMFEKTLKESANEGIQEELDEILATGDLGEARKFVIDEVAVSTEIEANLNKTLVAGGAPALSGEWARALKGVWASKWTDRAVSSRKQMNVPDSILFLAVLVQPIVPASYAFVIHTQSPLPSAKEGEQLIELCVGLGESLVSNSPGRALSATVSATDILVHVFPSKPEAVFAPEGGTLIFRSDSNGEDLEGFAGAGLYDSITVTECIHRTISYAEEPLFFDAKFREALLRRLYDIGKLVEANFAGKPQDIEGAVHKDGNIVVTQSRPQV